MGASPRSAALLLWTLALLRAAPAAGQSPPAFPLKASADGRHFVDQEGKPFLYHADTGWLVMKKLTFTEAEEYLDDRKARGFTAIHMHAVSKEEGPMTNREGHDPFHPQDDILKPVEAYWLHVDRVLSAARERGLLVALSAAWLRWGGTDRDGWRHQVTDANARAYGAFLGKRYREFPNLIWILCGDADPGEKTPALREMSAGLRAEAPHHLLTVHAAPEHSSAEVLGAEPWLDVNLAYTYQPTWKHVLAEHGRPGPARPLVLGESAYEREHQAGARRIRHQAYGAILSGALGGHAYGHGSIWKFAPDWKDSLGAEGCRNMVHLRDLIAERAWHRLAPDVERRTVAAGSSREAGDDLLRPLAARSSDGRLALAYLPCPRGVTVDLSTLAGRVRARWFDPTEGTYLPVEGSPFESRGKKELAPPEMNQAGDGDFVLVLESEGAPGTASPDSGPDSGPDFRPVREAIERGTREGRAPSLALAVVKDDRVVWSEGFGVADLERGTRATADSIYLLASVSKPLTATAMMVLVDRGRIDLDQPANRYLPGAKLRAHRGSAEEMTVRRLANHTAGLPVHYSFYYPGSDPPPWDEVIRRHGFAAFPPGARWEYSNLAYGLLGLITEAVSGTSWREFLEKEVFDPLGMARTSDRVRPGREGEATAQYSRDLLGRPVRLEPYGFDHPGASAIWSSANDLARFARLHLNGGVLDGVRLLREESAWAMQRGASESGPGSGYGIGWALGKTLGQRCYSHGGGMPGVSTVVQAFPDARAAVIVLTNTDGGGLAGEVAGLIDRALFPKALEPERTPRPAPGPTGALGEGLWEGRIEHWTGDIPLQLRVEEGGAVEVSFRSRKAGKLTDVALRGNVLTGRIRALLPTRKGFHGTPDLEFRLEREEKRMTGVCVALASGYFALSHWVELGAR